MRGQDQNKNAKKRTKPQKNNLARIVQKSRSFNVEGFYRRNSDVGRWQNGKRGEKVGFEEDNGTREPVEMGGSRKFYLSRTRPESKYM